MNSGDVLAIVQAGKQGTAQANLDHSYIRTLTLKCKKVGLTIDALTLMKGASEGGGEGQAEGVH